MTRGLETVLAVAYCVWLPPCLWISPLVSVSYRYSKKSIYILPPIGLWSMLSLDWRIVECTYGLPKNTRNPMKPGNKTHFFTRCYIIWIESNHVNESIWYCLFVLLAAEIDEILWLEVRLERDTYSKPVHAKLRDAWRFPASLSPVMPVVF